MKQLAKMHDAFAHGDWERDLRIVDSVLRGTIQSKVAAEFEMSLSQIQVICRRFHRTAMKADIRGDALGLPLRKHFSVHCMRLELEYWFDVVDHFCQLFKVNIGRTVTPPDHPRSYKLKRNLDIFEALLSGTSSVTLAEIHGISTARVFFIWNRVIVRLQEIALSRGMPLAKSDGVDVVRNNKNYWLECLDVMKNPQRGKIKRNEDAIAFSQSQPKTRRVHKCSGDDPARLANH